MNVIEIGLLLLIIICGIATCVSKNLMVSMIIFMISGVFLSGRWAIR